MVGDNRHATRIEPRTRGKIPYVAGMESLKAQIFCMPISTKGAYVHRHNVAL